MLSVVILRLKKTKNFASLHNKTFFSLGAVLVINMVTVQNLLASFSCVLGKTLYGIFPCLVVLASTSKF